MGRRGCGSREVGLYSQLPGLWLVTSELLGAEMPCRCPSLRVRLGPGPSLASPTAPPPALDDPHPLTFLGNADPLGTVTLHNVTCILKISLQIENPNIFSAGNKHHHTNFAVGNASFSTTIFRTPTCAYQKLMPPSSSCSSIHRLVG